MIEGFEAPYDAAPGRSRRGAGGRPPATRRWPRPRGEVVIVLDDDMQVVRGIRRAASCAITRPGSRLCVLGAVPVELERRQPARGPLREGEVRPPPRAARRSRPPQPAALLLHRQRLAAGRGAARGGRLRRVVRRLRQRGRRARRCGCAPPGSSCGYDPEALARQEYGKDLRRARSATPLEKGRTTVHAGAQPPRGLRRPAAGRPRRQLAAVAGGARALLLSPTPAAAAPSRGSSRWPRCSSGSASGASRSSTAPSSTTPSGQGSTPSCANQTTRASCPARRRAAPWPDRSSSTRIAASSAGPRTRCSC